MASVGVGRYGELLRRYLAIPGALQNQGREVTPDLAAAFVLENDRPEWAYLKGERLCIGGADLAAGGAGTFAQVQLFAPDNTNTLCVVERVIVTHGTGGGGFVGIRRSAGAVSAVAGQAGFRDARVGGASALPTCRVLTVTGALQGILIGSLPAQNAVAEKIELPFVLRGIQGDGSGLIIAAADNVILRVLFLWRERALEATER